MRRRTTRPTTSPSDEQHSPVGQVQTLLAEAQALSTRLAALNEIATAMQVALDAESVLRTVARQARWVLDFQHCSIALIDGEHYRMQVLRSVPDAPAQRLHLLGHGAIGRALRDDQALLLHHAGADDVLPDGMQSALVLPLRDSGAIIGTLNFFAVAPHRYTLDDLRIAAAMALQVASLLQNNRLFAEITQARDELHTVVESIGDSVLVFDQGGEILLMNGALRRLLGLSETHPAARRVTWLLRLRDSSGRRLLDREQRRAVLAARREQRPETGDGVVQLSDGRYISWICAPLVSTGTLRGFVLTLRDISAEVELEQLRDDLVQMLVHDLRTPLSAMRLSLDMLRILNRTSDAAEREDLIERARRSTNDLLRQVDMILDVNKLESRRLSLDYEDCEVQHLIDWAVVTVQPLAAHQQIRVQVEAADALPLVYADGRMLERVLENLLGNAIKFSPVGAEVTVRADLLDGGAAIEVQVRDHGPGVPENLREHIFEKYGQVRNTARLGTGLGLTFCKLAVEAHDGAIGVRPAPDHGSIFWFRLPLRRAEMAV